MSKIKEKSENSFKKEVRIGSKNREKSIKKPKIKRKEKQKFYDAVSDNPKLDENEKVYFIKSSFNISFMGHFVRKFTELDLWRVLIGSFFSALCVGYNWHLIAIICFIILMTSYSQWKSSSKSKAIEYCSQMLSKDEDRLKQFLDTISAPKILSHGKSGDSTCEWLNDIMAKFWPYINSIAQEQIDKKGFSRQGLDVGNGHKIYFERFTLGDKPPALTSIHVRRTEHRKDEIVLIIKLIYFGNCLVVFSYKTKVFLKASAGVKDVYFRGDAVITLRPLLEVPPFIGGISVCLQSAPLIDYNGINLANIADNKLFKTFIANIFNSYLVSPNKIFIPLIDNSNIKRELKYPLPIGVAFAQIIEAENLPTKESNRCLVLASDSFCKLRIGDYQFVTSIIYSCLNPYYDQSFSAPIHDFSEYLKIDVFDKDAISNDDFMGSLEFKLSEVGKHKNLNGRDKWLPIGGCSTGALHFRIAVFELSSNRKNVDKISVAVNESSVRFPIGILSVYIYYVSQISTSDEELDFKPVVKLKFSDQIFQTKSSKPPKRGFYYLEESSNFLCYDFEKDVLEVSVVCQEMKTMVMSKVFGESNIAVKDIIDANKDMTLNQDFPIKKILKFKDVTEVKNSGVIRMFLCLKVCKFRRKLTENLKIAASIQANIEQTTDNMNSITKLYREPVSSLKHPIRSIKVIGKKITPFTAPAKTIVAKDIVPVPTYLGDGCWVKIRIKWPDRKALHIEILKLIRIPLDVVEPSFQYAVCVKLNLQNLDQVLKNVTKTKDNNLDSKPKPEVDNKRKIERLQTRYTRKRPIVNFSTDIDFNERLIFKLSSNNNIDSHLLEFFLIICQPRKYFAVIYDSRYAGFTVPIKLPKVDFKGDPIEKWLKLNLYESYKKNINI